MPTPEAAYTPTGIVWLNRSARLAVVHVQAVEPEGFPFGVHAHASWLMGPDGEHMLTGSRNVAEFRCARTVARDYYDEQCFELARTPRQRKDVRRS